MMFAETKRPPCSVRGACLPPVAGAIFADSNALSIKPMFCSVSFNEKLALRIGHHRFPRPCREAHRIVDAVIALPCIKAGSVDA
jgi:hypothetical protein